MMDCKCCFLGCEMLIIDWCVTMQRDLHLGLDGSLWADRHLQAVALEPLQPEQEP